MGSYNITTTGDWPQEVYNIVPTDFNYLNDPVNAVPRRYTNLFRFFNNPIEDINHLLDYYNDVNFTYSGLITGFDVNGSNQISSDNQDSSFTWNVSSFRKSNRGSIFNYFDINFSERPPNYLSLDSLSSSLPASDNPENYDHRSYVIYPQTLTLIPVSLSANPNGTYNLVTSAVFLSPVNYQYNSYDTNTKTLTDPILITSERSAYNQHLSYINNLQTIQPLNSTPSNFNLFYSLCATKNVINNPLISFKTPKTNTPLTYTTFLETVGNNTILRPDSIFIKYAHSFVGNNGQNVIIGQTYPEEQPYLNYGFRSSFINNFTINNPTFYTFQLIQSTLNASANLEDISNCILSMSINLTSTNVLFKQISGFYIKNKNIVNLLSGVSGRNVELKYIADSPKFFNNKTPVLSAVTVDHALNTSLSKTNDTVTWTLPFSPHYYSYKLSFTGSGFTKLAETSNLGFSLSTWPINISTSSLQLSSALVSNFNIINADLPTYAPKDNINLKVIDFDSDNTFILSSLSCFYGSALNDHYDLIKSPYVPVVSASQFLLTYPCTYGEITLVLRTSLSSSTFGHSSDSPNVNIANFSTGLTQFNFGYPIYLDVLQETQNQITVDSAFLSSYPDFPARDLRNSLISWSCSSFPITPSTLSLYSVDSNDNIINYIPQNSAIPFNNTSWTVRASGYGVNTAVINLSSQLYNEVATISTNPILFNYFSEGQFTLKSSPITISNQTANLSLSSYVKVDDIYYNIPSDTQAYWTWSYDSNTNSSTQPISAYYPDGTPYNYTSTNFAHSLSSLNFKVALFETDNPTQTHNVSFKLNSKGLTPNVIGNYNVILQDYPNTISTDFTTTYNSNTSIVIGNTLKGINVITRPNNDLNSFKFFANNNILPKINASLFQWTISDDQSNVTTFSSTNFSDISSVKYIVAPNATTTLVTLSALSATIAGWGIPHDRSSSITIYTLPTAVFFNQLKFINYPPYTWLQNNSGYLTLIDSSNYTISQAPTAYGNKKSNSQNFYLSANYSNKSIYQYAYGSNSITLTPQTSSVCILDIPYTKEFYQTTGMPLSLTAYNNFFPQINGLTYTGVKSNSSSYVGYFPITSQSIPFNNLTYGKNGLSAFNQSPKIVPYPTLVLSFSTIDAAIVFDYNTITQFGNEFTSITSINLDNNPFVGIVQTIAPQNTANNPLTLSQLISGTVTYSLSSPNWISDMTVPSINGIYELFYLNVGNPSLPFTVSPYKFNSLVLSASASAPVIIPPTTFNLYSSSAYTGDRSLWSPVLNDITSTPLSIVAGSTSVNADIYLSTYYSLTGSPIIMQFKTPEGSPTLQITSYNVYFGDGTSEFHNIDDIISHSYSSNGSYILSYDANYNNGQTDTFSLLNNPITIYDAWITYDQSKIRLLSETILTLPWTKDQIYIQPNEFGDVDIFNTAISRLNDNLQHLINNTQTINTDSPTLFYGWLGTNQNHSSDTANEIIWHTPNYNSLDYNNTHYASASGFSNIKDLVETENNIFVLDGTLIRAFSADKTTSEIFFDNYKQISQILINPVSIDYDSLNNNLYVLDNVKNRVHKLNLSFDYINEINIQLTVGNFGQINDPNKFNSPSELLYIENNIYILDYGNFCIKQYTQDLNWKYTYYVDSFLNDNPQNISVHPNSLFLYVLSENHNIYVFDHMGLLVTTFPLYEIHSYKVIKINFDENGDFLYVTTTNNIFKYTISGNFLSIVNIPNGSQTPPNTARLTYTSAKSSPNRSLVFSTANSIVKIQDIVTLFKVGQGLLYNYWSDQQLSIYRDEFVQDLPYNRSLIRLVQNIKGFRDTMDSRFVVVTEQTNFGTVTYFAKSPIAIYDRPVFSSYIENENIGVGVNEFNIPQVINREIKVIYDSLEYLASYLSITNINALSGVNTGCSNPFCWSWNAMSCYNLTLPVIRICNINPITYKELQSNFSSEYTYTTSNTWGSATSECCN